MTQQQNHHRVGKQRRWRRSVVLVAGPIVGLHLVAVVLLGVGWAASGWSGMVVLGGLAVAAYVRGLIHSMDFDHVAMIDTSIRKFLSDGRSTRTVGLAFSAGHSTVVVVAAAFGDWWEPRHSRGVG